MRSIVFAFAIFAASATALSPAAAQTPLFSENDELQILIEGPVQTVVRRAARNTDPVQATLSVTGNETRFPVALEPRGLSRRTGDICNFPPLRVDFDESVRGTIFRGQNR